MGKKKAPSSKTSLIVADENNDGSVSHLLVPGSTLEDYFHSMKFDPKRDMQVSKHLLVGSPTNNAMAMEREDDRMSVRDVSSAAVEADAKSSTPDVKPTSDKSSPSDNSSSNESGKVATAKSNGARLAPPSEAKATPSVKMNSDDNDARLDDKERDEYEDDYESESPSPDRSVAGMTLSDYLQAKETENIQDDSSDCEYVSSGAAAGVKPKKHESGAAAVAPMKPVANAPAPAAAKKANPTALVSGMSLDYYLGASSADTSNADLLDSDADSKSPTSKRKKGGKVTKSNAKATMLKHVSDNTSVAFDESAMPFQKRQTKKLRAKLKQQASSNSGSALSVSKSILLAESSALSLQSKTIPHSSTVASTKDKVQDRRRSSQHLPQPLSHASPQASQQHPLPKLVASSSSTHSLHSLSHQPQHQHQHQHQHHDVDSSDSNGDESEKLPPLAHY